VGEHKKGASKVGKEEGAEENGVPMCGRVKRSEKRARVERSNRHFELGKVGMGSVSGNVIEGG